MKTVIRPDCDAVFGWVARIDHHEEVYMEQPPGFVAHGELV